MLQMAGERIRGGICHAIHPYAKANGNYTKYYNKMGCKQFISMGKVSKITYRLFRRGKNTSNLDEKFIKNYDENSDKGYKF